ncbi:hypothetical protein MRX96_026271 [Rhipicephalus microplus]
MLFFPPRQPTWAHEIATTAVEFKNKRRRNDQSICSRGWRCGQIQGRREARGDEDRARELKFRLTESHNNAPNAGSTKGTIERNPEERKEKTSTDKISEYPTDRTHTVNT